MTYPQWIELECPKCKEVWEARVRFLDCGDGSFDMEAVAEDGVPYYRTSLKCPECGEEGELI